LVPAKAEPTGVVLFEGIIAELLHLSTAPMSFSSAAAAAAAATD